jgi:hypothetical protein
MAHHHKHKKEEHILLNVSVHLEELPKALEQLLLLLDDLDQPQESSDLDKFVKLTDSGDSDKLIDIVGSIICSRHQQIKWENSYQINDEPCFQVVLADYLAVVDDLVLGVLDG